MSRSSHRSPETGGVIVPLTEGEPVLRNAEREISVLLAREEITITYARYSAGQQVVGPHAASATASKSSGTSPRCRRRVG